MLAMYMPMPITYAYYELHQHYFRSLLHLDMVVRDDKGNLLDPSQHSVIGVYRRVSGLSCNFLMYFHLKK